VGGFRPEFSGAFENIATIWAGWDRADRKSFQCGT
jgi:hypothetical protein